MSNDNEHRQRYKIIKLNMANARLEPGQAFGTGKQKLLYIYKYPDATANLKVKIDSPAADAIELSDKMALNFITPFDRLFFLNDAASGTVEMIIAEDFHVLLQMRLTMNEIQQGVLSSAVSIGVAATPIPVTAFTDRINLALCNFGSNNIFIGHSGVTTVNGYPLFPNQKESYVISPGVTLWGIVAAATEDMRIIEGA